MIFDEHFFRKIEESAKIGAWSLDVESGQTVLTSGAYQIFGIKGGIPTRLEQGLSFFPTKENQILREKLEDVIQNGGHFESEAEFLPFGAEKYKWVKVTGYADQLISGKVVRVSGTIQDITALKVAEQNLRYQKEHLDLILEKVPAMIFQYELLTDGSSRMPFLSWNAFEIYEIDPKKFDGDVEHLLERVHPDDLAILNESIQKSADDLSFFQWTGRLVTQKSGIKYVTARSVPRRTETGGTLWNGILFDITEETLRSKRERMQREQMFHQSKLASVGELAAGLGHEINNPLAIAAGNMEKLKKLNHLSLTKDIEVQKCYRSIENSMQRIVNVVSGLKDFCRMDSSEQRPFDVVSAIRQDLQLVEGIYLQEGISIQKNFEVDEAFVDGNMGRIQQVALNLLSNARDALKNAPIKHIVVNIRSDRYFVYIEISDSGAGIDASVKDNLFQSFVTTKGPGAGTGLGLSLAERIVRSHGGEISFDRSLQQGASFQVKLPKCEPQNSSATQFVKPFEASNMTFEK